MKIIGWIREGDKTACGGTVVEGLPNCASHGRAISFQGARIACRKGCVIVEGFPRATLPNGRPRVIHGMITSGGCPCYSTLNDIDGVVSENGEAIAEHNADGEWIPVKDTDSREAPYDEQPKLIAASIEGVPYYVETMDGRAFPGRTGADGLLPRIGTYSEDEYTVYWGDEALAKMGGIQA